MIFQLCVVLLAVALAHAAVAPQHNPMANAIEAERAERANHGTKISLSLFFFFFFFFVVVNFGGFAYTLMGFVLLSCDVDCVLYLCACICVFVTPMNGRQSTHRLADRVLPRATESVCQGGRSCVDVQPPGSACFAFLFLWLSIWSIFVRLGRVWSEASEIYARRANHTIIVVFFSIAFFFFFFLCVRLLSFCHVFLTMRLSRNEMYNKLCSLNRTRASPVCRRNLPRTAFAMDLPNSVRATRAASRSARCALRSKSRISSIALNFCLFFVSFFCYCECGPKKKTFFFLVSLFQLFLLFQSFQLFL